MLSVGSEEGNRKIKAGASGPTSSAASTRSVTYRAASIVKLGQAEWADLTKPMKLMGSVGSTNKNLTGGAALTRTAMPRLRRKQNRGERGRKRRRVRTESTGWRRAYCIPCVSVVGGG